MREKISKILIKHGMPTRQIAISEIEKLIEEAYEKGRNETAVEVDQKFVDFLKSAESNQLLDKVKHDARTAERAEILSDFKRTFVFDEKAHRKGSCSYSALALCSAEECRIRLFIDNLISNRSK